MNCNIVAEIGTAHLGSLSLAEELIKAAKIGGASTVKFQAVVADEIVHPAVGLVPLPGGSIALYDKFKSLEQDINFYRSLKEITEHYKLNFLCTPFGLRSFHMLQKLRVMSYKVASPELNHLPLIDAIAQTGKPMLLSLGVSRLSDIEDALEVIDQRASTTLLQCVTSYPAPEEEYNLALIPHLRAIFNVSIGLSDHSLDPILVPSLAVYCGATVVEKHICLSRDHDGLDDPIALEPSAFKEMSDAIALMESNPQAALYNLISRYGQPKIDAVMGDGCKRLAPSERANYGRTNRSICAIKAINKGDIISYDNSALYRVEKELKPGLSPKLWPVVIGRRAHKTIKAGDGISFSDLAENVVTKNILH